MNDGRGGGPEGDGARVAAVRWPLLVWCAQLVPASLVLVVGLVRMGRGEPNSGSLTSIVAAGLGAAWLLGTLVPLAVRVGRDWLVENRKEWLLTGGVLVAGLVVTEVTLGVAGLVPSIADQRARSLGYTFGHFSSYRLVPKEVVVDGGETIHINRRGFRGPEIESPKPRGRVRIVFLGGSHVFDYDGGGGGWPARAGEILRDRGLDVDVVNAAVPGNTTTDALATLLTDVWVLEPDIVFVCGGWNDAKYFPRVGRGAPLRELPPPEPASWRRDWRIYPEGLDRLLSISALYRLVRWGIATTLFTREGVGPDTWSAPVGGGRRFDEWGPRQLRLNLELLATLTDRVGADLVLCRQARRVGPADPAAGETAAYARRTTGLSLDELERAFEAIDGTVADLAARGATQVDMHAALSGNAANFTDAIHFSPAGSRAAGELVATALEPLVRARSRPSAR